MKLIAAARVIPKLFFPHEVRLALLNSLGRTLFRAGGGAVVAVPPRRGLVSATISSTDVLPQVSRRGCFDDDLPAFSFRHQRDASVPSALRPPSSVLALHLPSWPVSFHLHFQIQGSAALFMSSFRPSTLVLPRPPISCHQATRDQSAAATLSVHSHPCPKHVLPVCSGGCGFGW